MSKFCPFCGEELVDGARFCKSCGKNLDDYQNIQTDESNDYSFRPPVVENEHTLAYILGIVFAIVIPIIGIIIGVYLYTRKDSSKAQHRAKIVIGLSAVVWIASIILTMMF